MEKTTNRATRKRYPQTFKEEAVQLAMRPGAKLKEIAENLGVSVVTLRVWRKQIAGSADAPVGLRAEDLEKRLREMEIRLVAVTEERDILKKACGILSTPSRGGMHK